MADSAHWANWTADSAKQLIPEHPNNTWLIYQAQSYLGRPASLEEAQELFSRIDVHTRQPIVPAPPRRWYSGLLEALNQIRR